MSHSRTEPSWWPDTTVAPSPEKSTALHVELDRKVRTSRPESVSQSFSVRSVEPVTIWRPSGENRTACTLFECPVP
eukprot:CAMPEP_0182561848 /NCGR_PEP_ID=MMETSP1324-20130603/4271_1 /TAXON_ID=236786 /ORGANISM="Florenciella sp., Strain RCC1587" /LENGTH=75 /DNA_ID=CAMNT_0024774601 /DNA_START=392 /DNA_END=619 /DNA_ORIENTATION=+